MGTAGSDGMGCRAAVAASLVAASLLVSPLGAEEGALTGAWIGGFRSGQEWTYLQARFGDPGGVTPGSIDLPFIDVAGAPVHRLEAAGARVAFDVETPRGTLRFEGTMADRLLTGLLQGGAVSGELHMLRVEPLGGSAIEEYEGVYELKSDHFVYLQRWEELGPGSLVLFDEDGEIRVLYPGAQDTFSTGPGAALPVPVESRLRFTRDAGGRISGFTRRGPGNAEVVAARNRTFKEEPVTFANGGVRLAGTLFEPPTKGPHPALVITHGSGPQDRRGSLPFVRFLVRRGWALLAYDKRGVGGSGGDWHEAGFEDLAGDGLAAVGFLKGRPEIDQRRIGVFGVSQGGWIAPLVASHSKEVAFVVAVVGPAVTPAENERDHTAGEMKGWGFSDDEIKSALSSLAVRDAFARTGQGWEALQAVRNEEWAPYLGPLSSRDDPFWGLWRRVLDHDPAPVLKSLRCPVLAVFGERDTNVQPRKNKELWEASLRRPGSEGSLVAVLASANHPMMEADTGVEREIPRLKRFVPAYFETLGAWLSARAAPTR